MIRSVTQMGPMGLALSVPFLEKGPDSLPYTKPDKGLYESMLENESGFERLYRILKPDEFGNLSQELNSVLQAAITAGFFGAAYGGFIKSRFAYLNFIERNEATIFKSPLEAKRKLQDQVTIGFGKGALNWSLKLGGFTGTYCGISTAISVYRGKSSIYEYVAAGAITGGLYRCHMGLRGAMVGSGVGLVLGTLGGAGTLLILQLTGMSMEEMRFWQYKYKQSRLDVEKKMLKMSAVEASTPLLEEHDRALQEKNGTEKPKKFL